MADSTLYYGGTILTLEDTLYAQALLEENGRIRYVGSMEQAQQLSNTQTRKVDLQGKTLMPAFLDPHSHFMAYANAMLQVPLGECATQEELCQKLADFVQEQHIPKGQWVKGTGYDHNCLQEGTPPKREMLDTYCPEHPVIIQHASGHVGVYNTRALEQLGVTEATTCPEGGVMEVDAQGKLTGYMEENAFLFFQKKVPMDDPQKLLDAMLQAQERYASYGITTVQEGMFMDAMVPLYQQAMEKNLLKLDVVAYKDPRDCQQIQKVFQEHEGIYRNHLKLGGNKIFLDGSPQGRTAWLRIPYEGGEKEDCGYPVLTDQQVYDYVAQALEQGVQLLAHCNGDRAAEQYLTVMAQVERDKGKKLERPVMVHAQLLGEDQMEAVKSLTMIPSFFVAHVYHLGDVHLKNLGRERASHISPAASALKHGILFTFHQDTPVIAPNMLETVWCAVNRITKEGKLLGAEERIPVLEALKAVTINAAYQYFEEEEKGTLKSGKQANFVILSHDPLRVPPSMLRDIQVLETIQRGQTIYRQA